MYKILVDGKLFCDSRVDDLAIIQPVVTLAMNAAGSFVFTIPSTHPKYDLIQRKNSIVSVYRDEETDPIFQGMACEESVDIFKQKTITCEGELSYFNDSVLRPAKYTNVTPLGLLTAYITEHNAQVEEKKRFEVGTVTVTGNINCYTNMNSTMTEIKEDLIDDFGGYMMVRYANGHKYIDYYIDAPHTSSQVVELGKNLTDYNSNIDDVDIATRVIPLGATSESATIPGLDTNLTIASVNSGKDYLQSNTAVANFGIISKTIEFKDVTTASALKTKGQKYLDEVQFENVVIEASAIDFGYISDEFRKFRIMDYVHVKSEPHGMDKWFTITKMTINLNEPEKDRLTFGKSEKLKLSAKTMSVGAEIAKALGNSVTSSEMQNAIAQATALITGASGGYVKFNYDSNGKPYEILIMNTDDIATATKVWRWNQNGFGYSSHGYAGPYGTAITMNGGIVADYITSGTMHADRISGGTLSLGGANNTHGTLQILDASGAVSGTWNNSGIDAIGTFTSRKDASVNSVYAKLIKNGVHVYSGETEVGHVGGSHVGNYNGLSVDGSTYVSIGELKEVGGTSYYVCNMGANPGDYTERHVFFGDERITGNINLNKNLSVSGTSSISGTSTFGGAATFNNTATFNYAMQVNNNIGCSYNITASGYTKSNKFKLPYTDGTEATVYTAINDPFNWGYNFYRFVIDQGGLYVNGRINEMNGYTWLGDDYYTTNTQYRLSVGGAVWCTSLTQGSDRKLKKDIVDLDDKLIQIFDEIHPVSFKHKNVENGVTHFGYIAQDVEEAMEHVGISKDDFALVDENEMIVDQETKETEKYLSLNYIELFTLYDLKIRQLEKRIEELEDKLNV